MTGGAPVGSIERMLRELAPAVLAATLRRFRDFAACEDAVQDALLAAALQWPRQGIPAEPRAWLMHVTARRLTDHIRSDSARRRREELVVSLVPPEDQVAMPPDLDEGPERDDSLALLLMCCHPSLTSGSAIALTLRAVGGLTTAEIASAFLVPEATMAQRIRRAKQTIRASGAPFGAATDARLSEVLHVVYLIFNEGYATSSGPMLQRSDLASEAIRLARIVHALRPDDAEVAGLLALMLLTDARRIARTGPRGELIPLDEQDRSLWDRSAIEEGIALLTAALARGSIGSYQVQAAIAAVHDRAAGTEDTDWPEILALYDRLQQLSDSPVVALNRAVATAMVHGPTVGLELLETLDGDARLAGGHRLDAVRGHLFERAGDDAAALDHYLRAANRANNAAERDYLLARAARLRDRAR